MCAYIHTHTHTCDTYRAAEAKDELISRLQAQLELSARVATNLTADNHAAVKEIEMLTDKVGTQEQEILRLNGLVLGVCRLYEHLYI